MRMLYSPADWPVRRDALAPLDQAASRLYQKLSKLDIEALEISAYSQRYLRDLTHVHVLRVMLQRYAYLLAWALDGSQAPYEQFVLVDYGGGTGILSLLAREMGIGRVIYNDIYEVSTRDARVIAQALGLPAEMYVTGDLAELNAYFQEKQLRYQAVVSYDVIEHIYDIEGFLRELPACAGAQARIVMASSANPFNPRIRAKLEAHQRHLDAFDRPAAVGDKQRDTHTAYARVRAEIIRAHAAALTPQEI